MKVPNNNSKWMGMTVSQNFIYKTGGGLDLARRLCSLPNTGKYECWNPRAACVMSWLSSVASVWLFQDPRPKAHTFTHFSHTLVNLTTGLQGPQVLSWENLWGIFFQTGISKNENALYSNKGLESSDMSGGPMALRGGKSPLRGSFPLGVKWFVCKVGQKPAAGGTGDLSCRI